jgi:hypothetical protein
MACLLFSFGPFYQLWKFGFILIKDFVSPLNSSSSHLMFD